MKRICRLKRCMRWLMRTVGILVVEERRPTHVTVEGPEVEVDQPVDVEHPERLATLRLIRLVHNKERALDKVRNALASEIEFSPGDIHEDVYCLDRRMMSSLSVVPPVVTMTLMPICFPRVLQT